MAGIKVGDAVIDLFVNLASLDELESRMGVLPSKAASASTSVSGSLDGIAKSATGAGNQAAVAGEKIAAAGKVGAAGIKSADEASQSLIARMKAMEAESEQLRARVAALAEQLQSAGHRGASAFHEAQGEAALLGEITGVRLPRHVRTFLAEIPGVATALSAAFEATAILFIIEAVAQLGEKIAHFVGEQKDVADAWEQVQVSGEKSLSALDDKVIESQKALDELTGNHLAVLRDELLLIDHASLKELGKTFEDFGKTADGVFEKMESYSIWNFIVSGESTSGVKNAHKELDDFTKQFDNLIRAGDQQEALQKLGAEVDKIKTKVVELNEAKHNGEFSPTEIVAYDHLLAVLTQTSAAWDKITDAQSKQEQAAKNNELVKALGDQAAAAKRNLDAQLAGIEQSKVAQEAAYAEGRIGAEDWARAQIKAANDAAAAQIAYKEQLLDIAKKGVDGSKAVAAAQELATEKITQQNKLIADAAKAIEKSKDEAAKLREEWEKQDFATKKVQDVTRALDELTKAEQKLGEAEKTLALARSTADFSRQESDIQRLAQFSVITEEEKERRLKALYERERADALQILETQQSQELAVLNQAKLKFEAASKDALFPQAELADLKRKLDEAQIAYDRTATQIVRVNEESQKKTFGLISAERELIATQLAAAKAKQEELQQERALAAERGDDTKGIDKQIAATKQYETELQRLLTKSSSVLRTKPTWDSFFSDLTSRSLRAGEAFKQMASLFADAMASSVQAAVDGSAGFGEAMAQIVKSTLASLAGAAVGHVLTEIAKASSDFATAASLAADPFTAALAPGFIASAHAHLVAAAEWGAIGAGAAIGGAAIPSGGGSSAGASSGTGGPAAGSTAASAAPQTVQVQNIQHFAGGGFVSKRQLAVVGDSETGGDQAEVIIPLEDESAKRRIAAAFLTAIMASQPGVTSAQRSRIIARAPALSGELANPQIFTAATRSAAAQAVQANRAEAAKAQSREHSTTVYETHHHEHNWRIDGVISPDNMRKVIPKITKEINRQVNSGETKLHSSTSRRVAKRG